MGSGNQSPMVERHQTRVDQVIAMARRHAEEIRASAEEEAEPLVVPPRVVPAAARPAAAGIGATTRPSDDQDLTVAFVAAGDCWISIASDDGTWNERVLKASERHVVHARGVVSFRAGNAGALSVLINDRPTVPLGAEGRVVTRRITRENYRSFLAS
jgi:hypothetical protein